MPNYNLSLVAFYICQVARFEPKGLGEQLEQPVPQILHLFGVLKYCIPANRKTILTVLVKGTEPTTLSFNLKHPTLQSIAEKINVAYGGDPLCHSE